ncbi:hypothetical protein LTS10_003469 [Elasticomyces elasticus]|nr:hypothetical protein LTS10_003469 [Elasticomyces elasticus]
MPPAGNARTQAPQIPPVARRPIVDFFLRTWLGNVLAVTGLLITVLGVAWAIYTGVLGLRYGALQTCATLYSIGKYSRYCNNTLNAGFTSGWQRLSDSSVPSPYWLPGFMGTAAVFLISVAFFAATYIWPSDHGERDALYNVDPGDVVESRKTSMAWRGICFEDNATSTSLANRVLPPDSPGALQDTLL